MAVMGEEARVVVPMQTATVLVAAPDDTQRAIFAGYLEQRGFKVVLTDNEDRAMDIARTRTVNMVVTGPQMPGLNGYSLTQELRETLPELPVILMSAAGDTLSDGLLDCALAVGEQALNKSPRVERGAPQESTQKRMAKLTAREREVLQLLADGLANKAIARQLSISPRTVENHRAQIMRKTASRSFADLVRLALSA
jgi:FixJ family two-component response regulator